MSINPHVDHGTLTEKVLAIIAEYAFIDPATVEVGALCEFDAHLDELVDVVSAAGRPLPLDETGIQCPAELRPA